jgi:quinol-cytochrome oxidoreductase complex cytochrome b subunit
MIDSLVSTPHYDLLTMVEWLAVGFVILGALTMVVAAVLANIVFFRYPLPQRLSAHDPVARRAAGIALAISLLRCAALTFAGASVLVLGLVVGNGTAPWTLLIPLSPLAFIAVAVVYARRRAS